MAIVEMSKFKLLGLINNQEDVLNALFKFGFFEMDKISDFEIETDKKEEQVFLCADNFDRTKKVIDFIVSCVESEKNKVLLEKADLSYIKNFFVSYNEFINILDKEETILKSVSDFEKIINGISQEKNKINGYNNLYSQMMPYYNSNGKFSDYYDTNYSRCFYGTIALDKLLNLESILKDREDIEFEVINRDSTSLICIICHRNEGENIYSLLSGNAFSPCPYHFDCTAKEKLEEIKSDIDKSNKKIQNLYKEIYSNLYKLKNIKILCDRYKFENEKVLDKNDFYYTQKTFLLEGYVPTDKIEEVTLKLKEISDAIFIETSKPKEDEVPPTLVKNKPIVRQTEFVTDMYSTPNYREMDPSKVIFFFFMLFMGIIMADVGYGVIMVVLGLILARKIKVDNGTRRLWYIITLGGISTIIFGLLFNSFFGVSVFSSSVLPNPVPETGGEGATDMTGLMVILMGCLGLGVLQIAVGYFCKAINCFKQGDIIGGIFEGIDWVVFFIGLVFAGMPLLFSMLLPNGIEGVMGESASKFFLDMQTPGLIILIVTIVLAALTAGRNEKGFGKFTKGFGAVYGLINLMSDILSYARLFGLMLSGMIIAQTFNDMGLSIMSSGGVTYVLGGIVIVIGHVFNVAMNVLGAYIHDSRLQYIEFFGKFYTGEGRKFTPLGSSMNYIYLTK